METDEALVAEYAERIVIEYANISGREDQYRAHVRKAAETILPELLARARTDQDRITREEVKKEEAAKNGRIIDWLGGLKVIKSTVVKKGNIMVNSEEFSSLTSKHNNA